MKYPDEVLDSESYAVLKELPVPLEKELQLAMEIVKDLSGDLDFDAYKDEYRERIEALVRSKMEGVVAVPDTKKAKPAAKSLMEALRMTAESLK